MNWGNDMKLVFIDGTPIRTDNALRCGSRIHGSGTITKEFPNKKPGKSMCLNFYDQFYNGEGAKECWSFKSARVVNKVGYGSMHVCNGPDTIMEKTLSCWHGVSK